MADDTIHQSREFHEYHNPLSPKVLTYDKVGPVFDRMRQDLLKRAMNEIWNDSEMLLVYLMNENKLLAERLTELERKVDTL